LKGDGGSRTALIESLLKLRNMGPDVVLSSGFVGETGSVNEVTGDEWRAAIDKEIQRLERKSGHQQTTK